MSCKMHLDLLNFQSIKHEYQYNFNFNNKILFSKYWNYLWILINILIGNHMCSSLSFYSIQNHNLCHFLFFLFLFMKYVTFLIGDMTLVLIWLALDYRKKEKKRKLREEPPIQAHISHQPKLGINGEKVKHKKVQVSWPSFLAHY